MSRAPAEIQTTRMGPLARLPAFFALEGKRAVVAGGSEPAAWKAELLSAAGARVEVFAVAPGEEMRGARRRAAARRDRAFVNADWAAGDFAGAAIAVADCADDQRGRAIRRGGARGRRAGQRHRPAGVLRFFLRRHRQSLAARHRHFHRRRGAGLRPGDPRQDRGADPERLCALGRRRAHLAAARAGARSAVSRPPQLLGKIHRARGRRARPGADRGRSRRAADAGGGAARRARSFSSAPAPAIRNC